MLPTSNISVTHVIKPEELLAGITKMKVIIKDNSDPFRVQLSHRELLGTWEQEISKFKEGDLVAGLVLSVEDYGIFIRLSQNLSGLAEPTELNIKPGDLVSVQILCIKPEAMKTRLNITERIEIADPKELEEAKKMKFNYYITSGNIDKWVYSVDGSRRTIETVFHN